MMRLTFPLLLLAGLAQAGDVTSVFGPGEQTTYEVSYMGLSAGRAEITVGWTMDQFGREVWPLVCVGETTDLGAVYPIKDRFITYWDPRERKSMGADFIVHENKYRSRERFTYDHQAGVAHVQRQVPGRPPSGAMYEMEQGTLDLAAAGFALRNTPLVVGQVHEMPIFTGRKLYKMQARVVGRETITTGLGTLEVFRITVNGDFSGKLATEGLMQLFYTADEKQLPVRAEAKLVLGTVKIEAVKYEPGRRMTGEL